MVSFDFSTNASFLSYPSHPITVPRKHIPDIDHQHLAPGPVTIISPSGRSYRGRLYKGRSSWGEYYQVRTNAVPAVDDLSKIPFGQLLQVTIERAYGGIEVRLAFSAR